MRQKCERCKVLYQKRISGFVQQLVLLVHAWGVELVPFVDGGQLGLEHDGVLFRQTEPAGVVGGVVGGVLLDDLPPDTMLPPLVLAKLKIAITHIGGQVQLKNMAVGRLEDLRTGRSRSINKFSRRPTL